MAWIPILYWANYQGQHWKNKVWPTAVNKIKTAGSPYSSHTEDSLLPIRLLMNKTTERGHRLFTKSGNICCDFQPLLWQGKKSNPPTPSHLSWMQTKEFQQHWMNPTGRLLLLPAYVLLSLIGDFWKSFNFLFHLNLGKNSSTAPHYHHSLTHIFCDSFLLLGQHIKGKNPLFCS